MTIVFKCPKCGFILNGIPCAIDRTKEQLEAICKTVIEMDCIQCRTEDKKVMMKFIEVAD